MKGTAMNAFRRAASENGFSLVEVVIASALLGAVVLTAMTVVSTSTGVYSTGLAVASGAEEANRLLERLARDLQSARMVSLSADGASLVVQTPVDEDADGDITDASKSIEWGSQNNLGWSTTWRFEQTGTLQESMDRMDYNADGDVADTLAAGRLRVELKDAAGKVMNGTALSGSHLLSTLGPLGGDADSDGAPDPLFQRVDETGAPSATGRNLRVGLLVYTTDSRRQVSLARARTLLFLRNQP